MIKEDRRERKSLTKEISHKEEEEFRQKRGWGREQNIEAKEKEKEEFEKQKKQEKEKNDEEQEEGENMI